MTTLVAIRSEEGVVYGSDGQATDDNGTVMGHHVKKWFSVGTSWMFGMAGDLDVNLHLDHWAFGKVADGFHRGGDPSPDGDAWPGGAAQELWVVVHSWREYLRSQGAEPGGQEPKGQLQIGNILPGWAMEMLYIHRAGGIWRSSGPSLTPSKVEAPEQGVAIGSGSDFALGAMSAYFGLENGLLSGPRVAAGAEAALVAASRYDAFTGGESEIELFELDHGMMPREKKRT